MIEKLISWLFFSVVLSLIPLGAALSFQASRALPFNVQSLVSQGELLIVAAGICAAATAELFASSPRWREAKLIAGGATVAILLFSAIYFASIVTARQSDVPLDARTIYEASLYIFVSAFISSGACVALSKV